MTFRWLPTSALCATAIVASTASAQSEFAIHGLVRSSAGDPLPGAQVRLITYAGDPSQDVLAAEDGRFEFRQLERGRYLVAAKKPGFVEARFGASHPADAATPIVIGGVQVPEIVIALAPGAVIEGEVRAPAGEPAPRAGVVAVRVAVNPWTGARIIAAGTDERRAARGVADDRGRFRMFGLPAGSYVVYASWLQPGTGWIRGYHPAASTPADAGIVAVAPGEVGEARIVLREPSAPRNAVRGVVRGPAAVLNGTRVFIDAEQPDESFRNDAPLGPDGSFSFGDLSAGQYVLQARSPVNVSEAGPSRLWAQETVELAGNGAEGVVLTLQPGIRLTGQVTFEEPSQRSRLAGSTVVLQPLYPWQRDGPIAAALDAAGGFSVPAIAPGRYRASVTWAGAVAGRFGLARLNVNGVDWPPSRVVIQPTPPGSRATLLMTELLQKLTGALLGIALPDAMEITVLLIPADARLRVSDPERTRITRAATDATFEFADLMPGDYFLAAVRRPDADFIREPAFLQSVISQAIRLTVAPGEGRHIDLRAG